ncbi:MAG: SIS domain-containing protein [Lentisphaerae bacterium]|nr:SIS domain-containing protein [Lentisphaerota bacterium]
MSEHVRQSIFLNEVAEQPAALRDLVSYYRGAGRARLAGWADLAHTHRRVIFTGMGTSEFAPEAIVWRLAIAGVDATTVDAGELLHYARPVPGLLAGISQSGESIETRQVTEARRGTGALAVIVNNEASSMARASDLVLPLRAGHETAISTKTYVNTVGLLHLMAAAAEGVGRIDVALGELGAAAEAMPRCDHAGIERAAALLADTGAIDVVSRGPAMAAAKQTALTFIEGTRCACAAFTGGAFRHGPLEKADSAHRVVFLIPEGAGGELLVSMAQEAATKGSHVVALASCPLTLPGERSVVLAVPSLGESLFPLAAATTHALLLEAIARRRGVEAGKFRYGGKITTRE